MNEAKVVENLTEESIYNMNSETMDEIKSQPIDQMSASNSDDYQNQYLSVEPNVYTSDYTQQANNESVPNYEAIGGKSVNYGDYYNYYANYYQNLNVKPDSSEIASQPIESHSNPRTVDLINKALAKQQLKALNDTRDDDEEEGQIPASPGCFNRSASRSPPVDSSRNSPYNTSHRSVSRSASKGRSIRSHSRSHKRHASRSRSRSPSRRRRRSRTRSRSRSPYYGPIIKDYRRGRRGFVRYPRGFRDRGTRGFRRGHHSQYNHYGNSRRQEYSRSRSRSFSPKRRQIEIEKSDLNSDEEKTMDSKLSETLKPSDIKMSEKRLTQSFLAMLEEKQNRAKMIPVLHNSDNSENDSNRRHGFVNTFNSVQKSDRKHTLSYDLEREGWQVIDDANSDSKHNRNYKSVDDDNYDHKQRRAESLTSTGPEKLKEMDVDSDSSDSGNKNKKSSKKSKKQKKKKKRKSSTSDSSDSESDNENKDEIETKPKKRSKKKKRKSKKKKKKRSSSSSSSSENEELNKKQKRKKKSKDSSSESQSEDKPEETESSVINQKTTETTNSLENSSVVSDVSKDNVKNKDKKRRKRKTSDSESSDSDSDEDNKKKKKKKKRKTSKKRKHRSSSSSSSDSSDSSESVDRKKKKKKKSKKSKTKKHKKRSEKKEKSKSNNEKKKVKEEEEEFVSVTAVGEEPFEIKWPKKLIKFTHCLPSLQYSVNPKVAINSDDFNSDQQMRVNQQIDVKESHKLATEYERFIGELNPNQENQLMSEDPNALESKLRDKLVKHFYDRNEFQKTDSMTSSERRAYERSKKHGFHSYEPNDDQKSHEDLKSAPLSAYYSPKVQKTSPNHKSNETENIDLKSNKTHELDHQNRISLTVEEIKDGSTHKMDFKVNESSKSEDRKRTAKELLERIKQKKHSDKDHKESTVKDKTDSKSNKKLPQIGKMKIPPKKKFVTTATADSTQNAFVSQPMKLDMNYDYNWYYNYYLNSVYGVGQYPQVVDPTLASAYYAHYSMLTSYDYNQTDLNSWMTQKGFTFDSTSAVTESQTDVRSIEQKTEPELKTEETLTSVESSDVNPDNSNNCLENVVKEESISEQISDLKNVINETKEQKTIEVLISSTNSELPIDDSTEPKSYSPQMSPFSSSVFQHKVKVRVTADSHNQIESTFEANDDEVGAPPPPPPRPIMTSFTSTEPVTLPNGVELPIGTKQIVVHPYKADDSYKFTAEWFGEAFNGQNSTTQTNSS